MLGGEEGDQRSRSWFARDFRLGLGDRFGGVVGIREVGGRVQRVVCRGRGRQRIQCG